MALLRKYPLPRLRAAAGEGVGWGSIFIIGGLPQVREHSSEKRGIFSARSPGCKDARNFRDFYLTVKYCLAG